MKTSFNLILLILLSSISFSLLAKEKPDINTLPKQAGVGTVDRYKAHGREVYRFVPDDSSLRKVKFVPGQLGYKKNKLPEEYETILATALKEKKKIYFECIYFDHGVGKTAIGKKVLSLKLN